MSVRAEQGVKEEAKILCLVGRGEEEIEAESLDDLAV